VLDALLAALLDEAKLCSLVLDALLAALLDEAKLTSLVLDALLAALLDEAKLGSPVPDALLAALLNKYALFGLWVRTDCLLFSLLLFPNCPSGASISAVSATSTLWRCHSATSPLVGGN
jgi:hypothetical protein